MCTDSMAELEEDSHTAATATQLPTAATATQPTHCSYCYISYPLQLLLHQLPISYCYTATLQLLTQLPLQLLLHSYPLQLLLHSYPLQLQLQELPSLAATIKLRWFGFYLSLLSSSKAQQRAILSLQECLDIGRSLDMDEQETRKAITFFHNLNLILHYQTDELDMLVIIRASSPSSTWCPSRLVCPLSMRMSSMISFPSIFLLGSAVFFSWA